MLVTFKCDAYENLTFFGDIAAQLLTAMGHSGEIPGALVAQEVPEALHRLQQKLHLEPHQETVKKPGEKDVSVSLKQRAFPLIAFLEAAVKAKADVLWDFGT